MELREESAGAFGLRGGGGEGMGDLKINVPITIRQVERPEEYRALQAVQRASWGLPDDSYVVPVATLVGANRHGGLVLGAFGPDGRAVGMSFAFLGRSGGRLCLYSQLTGIAPEYQDRGLGTKLKLAQRDFALREEIDLIAWTFDPLQAGNAMFNLGKLGATCGSYYVDLYGPREDRLNAGVPTDRILAEWEVSRPPREGGRDKESLALTLVVQGEQGSDGGVRPRRTRVNEETPAQVGIEIPLDMLWIRENNPQQARAWGLEIREAFLACFERGYRAVDFQRSPAGSAGWGRYVLERPAR